MITKKKLLEILKNYTSSQWEDWIDDIIHYQLAFPISNINNESDDLYEIVIFLQKNNISVKNYEQAFINFLNKTLPIPENGELIERLLDVLLVAKFSKSKEYLFKLFTNNSYKKLKGKYEFINSKVLNNLVRLNLTKGEIILINERLTGIGNLLNEYYKNEAFILNYFRFLRVHNSESIFFSAITSNILSNNKNLSFVYFDSILELFVNKKESFYEHLFKWLVNDYSQLKDKKVYINLLSSIKKFIEHTNREIEFEQTNSYQSKYFQGIKYALKFIFRKITNDPEKFSLYIEHIVNLSGSNFIETILDDYKYLEKKQPILLEKKQPIPLLLLPGFCMYDGNLCSEKKCYKIENNTVRIILETSFNKLSYTYTEDLKSKIFSEVDNFDFNKIRA